MTEWNPSKTNTLGLEWSPHSAGAVTLDSQTKIAAMSLNQSVSQAIGTVRVGTSGIPQRGGLYVVEAYDNENGVASDLTTLTAQPNEDVSGTGLTNGQWREQDNTTTTTIYSQLIDNNIATYILNGAGGLNLGYYGRMNTGGLSLTGRRIIGIRLSASLGRFIVDNNTQVHLGLNIGGVDYYRSYFVPFNTIGYNLNLAWAYNPATKKPWTIADVQAFDTTDEWFVRGSSTPDGNVVCYEAWIDVLTVAETRIALGTLDDTANALTTGNAWNIATMLTPTGGTWTKDGAGRHLYTVRRINDTGSLVIPYLDSAPGTSPAGTGWAPTIQTGGSGDSTGQINAATFGGYITAMNAEVVGRMFGLVQRTTAPAESVDSQPYRALVNAPVSNGVPVQSEFSGAAAAVYGQLRFLVKYDAAAPPTADLSVQIRRRSDSAALGTAFIVTKAMVDAAPTLGGYKLVTGQQGTGATLAAATQYYVEFTSTTSVGTAWQIPVAFNYGDGTTGSYNGTTDVVTYSGADVNGADVGVTTAVLPTAPAGFTAALGSQTVGETICCVTSIGRADLSWTATALGGSFLRYEIQRSEDAGATWVDVARVALEATTTWKDYEALRGIAVTYRIRVIRTDLATSPWSTSASVTKTITTATMFLVSNFTPTLDIAYEYAPLKTFDFLEAEELVLHSIYRRDYRLAFLPTENRGATERVLLTLAVDDKLAPGGGKGILAFAPLRAIAKARIPYVCVLDHHGNRYYAALRVPEGEESQPAASYHSPMEINEVASTPYVVTA